MLISLIPAKARQFPLFATIKMQSSSPAPPARSPSNLRNLALLAFSTTPFDPEHHHACFASLPPKLKKVILQSAICPGEPLVLGRDAHEPYRKDAVALFLTSKQMYKDAASVFYSHIQINSWSFSGLAERFFTGTLSPRNWVRKLSIRFQVKDDISQFETLFPAPLRSMLEHGDLQELEVIIGTKAPRKTLFGSPSPDNFQMARLQVGENKDQELVGFMFVTEAPFQGLLHLLGDPRFKAVTMWIEALYHLGCWCPFHAQDAETECSLYEGFRPLLREDFGGDMPLLVLDWKRMVKTFLGAKVLKRSRRK
ncbi:hypothetical protein B0O99DRAFT_637672 [Bisporella sp. PMI_857]|nr:hypothetical protein B0O99DRAFT_637672 [Bisporella sp. PMI_857]